MKKTLGTIATLLLALLAYLMLWPVPIKPVAVTLPPAPGYSGVHAANTRLAQLQMIDLHDEEGPEHIAFGPDGKLYTTVASGNILRMNTDGSDQQVFANTGGRVLGFDFDAQGRLIAADAIRGLLAIDATRQATVLADKLADGMSLTASGDGPGTGTNARPADAVPLGGKSLRITVTSNYNVSDLAAGGGSVAVHVLYAVVE